MNNIIKLINEQLILLNKDFKFEYIQQIVPKKLRANSSITEYEGVISIIQITTDKKDSLFRFHYTADKIRSYNKFKTPLKQIEVEHKFRDLFMLDILFGRDNNLSDDNIVKSFRTIINKILNNTFKIDE